MKLYLLRHGKADWPDWAGPDDDRPLTAEGIEEMQRVGAALNRMKLDPHYVLSSPLPRALKTAELAAKALGLRVHIQDELRPGFSRQACEILLRNIGKGDVMLVGHEPDLSRLIRDLTGARVKVSKATIAAIEITPDLPAPRLLFLFPAKALVRLAD